MFDSNGTRRFAWALPLATFVAMALPAGPAAGQSLALSPTPPKLHCVLAGKSDTWITNASPGCYSFELTSNDLDSHAKAKAANPPASHFFVIYRVINVSWDTLPQNTPFRPETGTLAEGDFLHHRSAGSRSFHASGNLCCTKTDTPYPCCNDNSKCTGPDTPFPCCTGAKTGTCTLAKDSTCNTPEVLSWDGCTEANPADCPASSRWDMRHTIGSGGAGCFTVGLPYDLRAEGEHEFLNFASTNLRNMIVADADRLTNGDECSPACSIQGIRIDEPQLGYSAAGMDFTDVLELPVASSPTDAQNYVDTYADFIAHLKTQRPSFKVFPSLPFFLQDREGAWERQLISAAKAMATERVGSVSYSRICVAYSGNTCIEGSRAAKIQPGEWDHTLDSISTFARILYGENSPNIEVIIEPFRAGRGMTWLQELCADAGDACYFGLHDACGSAPGGNGCYSKDGVLSGISVQ
ncbi:MAG: hypothetical protein Q8R92_20630 [Deltaproteobacteria bacterium]|nr:hypothetical protein [Deltaproteobacteria bacterium]